MTLAVPAPSQAAGLEDDEALLSALWATAYRIAWLILRDHMAAEDVAQESCVRAVLKRRFLREPEAMHGWFRTLVTNLAISARRRTDRRSRGDAAVIRDEHSTDRDVSGELDLADAIAQLDDELRLPVVLVYFGGFTSIDVARKLGIASSTVRCRLIAARNLLRPLLECSHA